MYDEDEEYWCFEGPHGGVEFEHDSLAFQPSRRKNLLGHVAEWSARLEDWQVEELLSIADEDGEGLRIEWGVFMCPVTLYEREQMITVNTEGVW